MPTRFFHHSESPSFTRRQLIAVAGASAVSLAVAPASRAQQTSNNSKINFGWIGCGGRGSWIADLFVKNGNYNLVAVADYFQDRVDTTGDKLQVPQSQRFTGLNAYKRLLEQKLDAVAIISPPYFHPEHAAAAVDAGKHVYCAKPIAVDVHGCHTQKRKARRESH